MKTEFPYVLISVKTAGELLLRASKQSPANSNLRDELERLSEQVIRVQKALAANGYDLVGMES